MVADSVLVSLLLVGHENVLQKRIHAAPSTLKQQRWHCLSLAMFFSFFFLLIGVDQDFLYMIRVYVDFYVNQ